MRAASISKLILCVILWSTTVHAEVPISDRSRELFREGVAHLKGDPPRYAEAYEAFKAAYEDSPSPKILGNIGLCATKLERDGEAIEAYRRYLDEAGAKSAREKRQITADLEALEERVSRLTLRVTPSAVSVVDRRVDGPVEVRNVYTVDDGEAQLELRAGEHRITLEAKGYAPEELVVELAPGTAAGHVVALRSLASDDPEPEPVTPLPSKDEVEAESGPPIGMWVAIGATGALAIATGVVGGLAAANHGAYEDAIERAETARAAELREKGDTLNLTGDVLLGVTAAAAATAAVLVVLELVGETGDEPIATLTPVVTPNGAGLGVGARF